MAVGMKVGMKGGQQWTRVTGPNIQPQHKERGLANKSRLADALFTNSCKVAGVEATKRQASKWNNKKGAAYNVANKIEMNGFVLPEAPFSA